MTETNPGTFTLILNTGKQNLETQIASVFIRAHTFENHTTETLNIGIKL